MKIAKLNNIGIQQREKIVAAGIETLEALADLHTSPRACLELSQETGLSITEIREIISVALFSQVKNVEKEHSALLVKIGIDSLGKLANSDGDKLLRDIRQFNYLQGEAADLPSEEMLHEWIADAKALLFAEAENYEA